MTPKELSSEHSVSPTGQKVVKALEGGEALSEWDLFIRLRPVDRLALHRVLAELVSRRLIFRRDEGHLPGPVVTMYRAKESWF